MLTMTTMFGGAMQRARAALFSGVALAVLAAPGSTSAQTGAGYCAGPVAEDRSTPVLVPPSLASAFLRTFALRMSPALAGHAGYVRCASGVLLGCAVGADLPCGTADTRRSLPGADAWCRGQGDPSIVPKFATGSASIFDWRCADGRAVPTRQVLHVDRQGYVAEYWKPLLP